MEELSSILNSYSATDSGSHNFVSGKDSFAIDQECSFDFWDRICSLSSDSSNGDFHLAEIVKESIPLISEFQFEFFMDEDTEGSEFVAQPELYEMVKLHQSVMKETLNIREEQSREYYCIILHAEQTIDGRHVQKFRFQFPYCKVSINYITGNFKRKLTEKIDRVDLYSKFSQRICNSPTDAFKIIKYDSTISVYGSTDPDGFKFTISDVCDYISDTCDFSVLELSNIFTFSDHNLVKNGLIDGSLLASKDINYWAPLFLSITFPSAMITQKRDFVSQNLQRKGTKTDNPSEKDMMDIFLPMLKAERFKGKKFWVELGNIIYRTFNTTSIKNLYTPEVNPENKNLYSDEGDEMKGLDMWKKICAEYECTEDIDFEHEYYLFSDTGNAKNYTVKTLAWYAKQDNPDQYRNWHKKWFETAVKLAVEDPGAHTLIADCLYRLRWLDIVFHPESKTWYYFAKNRWMDMPKATELKELISTELRSKFENYRTQKSNEQERERDSKTRQRGEAIMKNITMIISELTKMPFVNNVTTAATLKFLNPNFLDLLDSNIFLTGVHNGMFEVYEDTIIFRTGKPEDYIKKSMPIPFISTFTWESTAVKKVLTELGKTIVDSDLRNFFLKFVCSGFHGRNSDKRLTFLEGGTNAAKSAWMKIMELTWGPDYLVKLDFEYLTEKKANTNSANPQLARAKNVRFVVMDEPERGTPIKSGRLKKMASTDSYFARDLYSGGGKDKKNTYKPIVVCNVAPPVSDPDKACETRATIINFGSYFSNFAPEKLEDQYKSKHFKMDKFFEDKVPEMAAPFLWILFQTWPKYIREGLENTESVTHHTKKYWENNDIYLAFASNKVENNENSSINSETLYNEFKFWYEKFYPKRRVPDYPIVVEAFNSRWGSNLDGVWKGKRIKIGFMNTGNGGMVGDKGIGLSNFLSGLTKVQGQ